MVFLEVLALLVNVDLTPLLHPGFLIAGVDVGDLRLWWKEL